MNKLHTAFFINLKGEFVVLINVFFVVTVRQLIVFTKKPIVLPLAYLNKVVMNSYAWFQLFLFFQNPLWVKYAFIVPLNQIIKGYEDDICCVENMNLDCETNLKMNFLMCSIVDAFSLQYWVRQKS